MASRGTIRTVRVAVAATATALIAAGLVAGQAGAGAADSAAVRGYIVPTPNNPDVDPATSCQGTFTANDQSDDQAQSPAGTLDNAVTLAGCSYDAPPYGGPSTEDRPVVFAIERGPGGLICAPGAPPAQVCALPGINHQPGAEYRVQLNSETGESPGTTSVIFCADDPPADGVCGPQDEQRTGFRVGWLDDGSPGGGGTARCAGKPATIVASGAKTKGTGGNDVIVGRPGKDRISGKGGKDRICGKGGKDRLKGGPGNDRLRGGPGKDRCKGGPGKDKLKSCEKGSD